MICSVMATAADAPVPAETGDLRRSGEKSFRRMDRRNRNIVRTEIERLGGPLDRWDTAEIARVYGDGPHAAFVGERYTGRVTAPLAAAVLRGRIRRVCSQAHEPPPDPPRLLDVENIVIDGSALNLPHLLRRLSATEIARRSGVPRSTVQRIKAGKTSTAPRTAIRLLRVVDESLAQRLEGDLADVDRRYLAWLAPVLGQIARDGPVREWEAGRQLLGKLRRRLPELDAEIAQQPHPDPELLQRRERIHARVAELEEADEHPPRDLELERQARAIRASWRHGAPGLTRAGLDPGGDLHRAEQILAAFGLRDADAVDSIDAHRVYKLRSRSRLRRDEDSRSDAGSLS